MTIRIFEIIRLIEERTAEENPPVTREIFEELMIEGYKHDEIEEALSWVEVYQAQKDRDSSVEIPDDFRQLRIKDEAYRYLMKLVERNIATEEYVEELLNYCLATSGEDIDLYKLMTIEKYIMFNRTDWAHDAASDFKAYHTKKDS